MRARRASHCQYCGSDIRRGMPIARASFSIKEANRHNHHTREVTQFVHARCADNARAEWPELNA